MELLPIWGLSLHGSCLASQTMMVSLPSWEGRLAGVVIRREVMHMSDKKVKLVIERTVIYFYPNSRRRNRREWQIIRKEDITMPSEFGGYQSYINDKIDQILKYADGKGVSPKVIVKIKERLDDLDVGTWNW